MFIKDQTTDGSGHDTHVAGVIGSRRFGVAKKINIYGIKVVDKNTGRSLNSDTIKAMELVVKDSKKRNCPKGVVVNMSLGGEYSQAMNDAVETLVSTNGIFVAVSAGNENQNASNFSPASAPWACTVGATTYDDTRYTESNWGKAVKIMAPGVSVLSLRPNKRTVSNLSNKVHEKLKMFPGLLTFDFDLRTGVHDWHLNGISSRCRSRCLFCSQGRHFRVRSL